MLLDLLNWTVFVVSACIAGHVSIDLFYRTALTRRPVKRDHTRDFAAGVLVLTAYAEIVSLFHAVDLAAFILLIIITAGMAVLIAMQEHRARAVNAGTTKRTVHLSSVVTPQHTAAVLILLFFLILSALRPSSYDDYLYHAEAVRWIEEYGVVPGLANLHGRFGFNSAFLCLSALFGWSWSGQSFHALNALFAGCMTARCLLTLPVPGQKKPFGIAALLKLCCLLYIAGNTAFLSGVDTDPSAMLATLYCFIRYAEIHEAESPGERERFTELSGIAVFAFFACTLKLSAAPAVLITIEPLLYALKNRRSGLIAASALGADLALIPFLIRNVILTGWIVYPFSSLDLFSFDFKVPASLVEGESQSIVLWGRSTMDLIYSGYSWQELVDMPVTQWAPIWFGKLSSTSQLFVLICAAALPLFLIYSILQYIRRADEKPAGWKIALTMLLAFSLLYWFFSAPSERFGGIYLLCLPACILGSFENRSRTAGRFLTAAGAGVFTALLMLRLFNMPAIGMIRSQFAGITVRPADYETREMDTNEMTTPAGGTILIYTPQGDETDQGDYAHFPSAPSSSNLKVITLRGESLKDGFRSTATD